MLVVCIRGLRPLLRPLPIYTERIRSYLHFSTLQVLGARGFTRFAKS
jgi:hypothetical protein